MDTSENNEKIDNFFVMFNNLKSKLSLLGSDSEIIAVDISDIYESAQEYIAIVNSIMEKTNNLEELEDTLILIKSELDHINWHYKSFKKLNKKLFRYL